MEWLRKTPPSKRSHICAENGKMRRCEEERETHRGQEEKQV
jgi:hypothetical protein